MSKTFFEIRKSLSEVTQVKSVNHSWGRMVTVHHGNSHSYPLHPEHQTALKNLKQGEKTSYKDETGSKVSAHRDGDHIHLKSNKTNATTKFHRKSVE